MHVRDLKMIAFPNCKKNYNCKAFLIRLIGLLRRSAIVVAIATISMVTASPVIKPFFLLMMIKFVSNFLRQIILESKMRGELL